MKQKCTRWRLLFLFLFLNATNLSAQVNREWVRTYAGVGNYYNNAHAVAVDAQGNIYVTGLGGAENYENFTTIKYDPEGNIIWLREHPIPGAAAKDIAFDKVGNVYITGGRFIIKYDTNGNLLWEQNGEGDKILVQNNFVYVAGYGGVYKLGLDGTLYWHDRYADETFGITADDAGNVYATGTLLRAKVITIKYNEAGQKLWVREYRGTGKRFHIGRALKVDPSGNVYVNGWSGGSNSGEDYVTIKYDAAGNELWVRRYNGPQNLDDRSGHIFLDEQQNVYIAGETNWIDGMEKGDITLIKYDKNGNQLWVSTFNGPDNLEDRPGALATDADNNLYVTGFSSSDATGQDFITIKYDKDGNQLWQDRYDGPGHRDDDGNDIAIDSANNVYVTGEVRVESGTVEYATIKYTQQRQPYAMGFTLINADTDKELSPLRTGDTINLAALNGAALNIRANTFPSVTGSVRFRLSGQQQYESLERNAPYALFANKGQDYLSWHPQPGDYELTAQAFEGSNGTGKSGDAKSIRFHVLYQEVSSFTLIDAGTDKDLDLPLQAGSVIDQRQLTQLLNIRANTTPGRVGSVVLLLDGKKVVENNPPYAYAANSGNNYFGMQLAAGEHTLQATPYSGPNGTGQPGKPLSIRFTIANTIVDELVLVNAQTDKDIRVLREGDVIDLSQLPTRQLNIRAVTYPRLPGSVVFTLGDWLRVRENYYPYAIGGDINGNYRPWTLPTGQHTLTATPYAARNAKGLKGLARSVRFTVIDPEANRQPQAAMPGSKLAPEPATAVLQALPNPFSNHTTIRFTAPVTAYAILEVYDLGGARVRSLFAGQVQKGNTYTLPFNSGALASGFYTVRLVCGQAVHTHKMVLSR